ncbi:hypothetical protein C2845_PM04G30870 [Panicum miliaceum]|uniref:Bifunctional inhibitor/plant lipid transfer protein/seed storage helical domain-containing protein n=1 Tax=Panicum miliaceum TaxID=4540 RepID=A0A3L6QRC5_PANMI|nr:hypothetical protein C2845_PM04G30870 [Panicum miliaceum]
MGKFSKALRASGGVSSPGINKQASPRPPLTPLPHVARSSSPGGVPCSCLEFLTNGTVVAPTAQCCDGFSSILNSAIMCLCHVLSREIDQYTHYPPINLIRVALLQSSPCSAQASAHVHDVNR